MEALNKFYSTVTSTVNQLSGVLPGNPVTREFEATQFIASAGPGLLWKVYKGLKKSTKQEASVFVLEKKSLDKWNKTDRDLILESLKRGVVQLTKLRHPHILTVQHGIEDSRDCLAFATEPVFASLANILGNKENMPDPIPPPLDKYQLYEIEIKYGLMQIAEGLSFLHNDVKLLHHNISPESIVVNEQGAWKIFGFDFCIFNRSSAGKEPTWAAFEYSRSMPPCTQPQLDYLAPETILSATNSTASDIYSLGMLIYTIHSPNHQTLGNLGNDYKKYKKFVDDMRNLPSKVNCVGEGLREYVKLMLNTVPVLRPDLHQFLKIAYFEDVGVKTLNYLDSLFQWDNLQKSQFYKGLPRVLQKMPHRICLHRIVPCLAKEFVNPPMIPFVLPNILMIAGNCNQEEFAKNILPIIKPVMALKHPIQILLIFMQKMELLLKLTPPDEVKSDILPMLYRALEADAQQIQELCLLVLPTFAVLIDYPAMKNAVLPRIKKLCMITNTLSVRVNCLLCLGKLLDHLDKWLVLDEVVPFLQQIPSKEPAVIMGILGIYKLVLSNTKLGLTKELMATKVLPSLLPLCVENTLTMNQFNSLMSLVKQMIAQIEVEHRDKIEQLDSIKKESKTMEQALEMQSNDLVAAPKPPSDIDQLFQGLGLDSFTSGTNSSNTTNKTGSDVMSSMHAGDTSLSIEEKKRLAQQQEAARLSQHNSIRPSTLSSNSNRSNSSQPSHSSRKSQPADLASTLLESNLTQLSTSSKYNNLPLSSPKLSDISLAFSPALSHLSSTTQLTAINSPIQNSNTPLNLQSSHYNHQTLNLQTSQQTPKVQSAFNQHPHNMQSPHNMTFGQQTANYTVTTAMQQAHISPPPSTYLTADPKPSFTMTAGNQTVSESFFGLDGQSFRSSKNYIKQDWSDFDTLLNEQSKPNQTKKTNSQSLDSDMMDLLS